MVFDEDGNGVITKAELTRILKANHMASSEAEVARKADTIMNQADKGTFMYAGIPIVTAGVAQCSSFRTCAETPLQCTLRQYSHLRSACMHHVPAYKLYARGIIRQYFYTR
jgi:hypothetical protein